MTRASAALLLVLLGAVPPAPACQCVWEGPFLQVAPRAAAVVRARVVRHHLERGPLPSTMDVQVLEVLRGRLRVGLTRVWGDNGALCRPAISQFPVGTEWVLAFDGPGSKPGAGQSPAISVCGRYWLRVEAGDAVGVVVGQQPDAPEERIALDELWRALSGSRAEAVRIRQRLAGQVGAGERREHPFGDGFRLVLAPIPGGWTIEVRQAGRDENLARLTPPLHGPNPCDIEGWHFRNADNTGPNEAGDRNVNAPQREREFVFSPAVGGTIAGPDARTAVSPEDIEAVGSFGRGTFTIGDYQLRGLGPDQTAQFEWMRYAAELTWLWSAAAGP